MQLFFAALILVMWFFLYGLECYLNGLMCRRWWSVPFVGFAQDIKWLIQPVEGAPGILHFAWMHGGGLGIPAWLIYTWLT